MEQPITLVQNGPLTIEIHEGQKGDPGKSLRFEDLTPEQMELLKGPKGDKGDPGKETDVKDVYDMLVNRGYLPNSSSLTDVLKYIIDKAGMSNLFENAELTVRTPVNHGDTTIEIGGIAVKGVVIKEKDTDNTYTLEQDSQWSYPFTLSHPMDERPVILEAIWQGTVKSTLVIPGIQGNLPIEIGSDPAYEVIEGPHKIDYKELDDQLWLRQSKSPSLFGYNDISRLVSQHNIGNKETLVLDLIAEDTIQLSDASTANPIEYKTLSGSTSHVDFSRHLIIEPSYFNTSFINLIVVYPDKPVDAHGKTTITFVAPKNIHVGTAVKGTTTVSCIPANEGDVVQIDIMNRAAKIIGTNGITQHL